jgi:methylated-DNA-[protein]-cysteine S-methyltransferase
LKTEEKLVDVNLNSAFYISPLGPVEITEANGLITSISFEDELDDQVQTSASNSILQNAIQQLDEYFQGNRTSFDLPIKANGTDFQQKVWTELQHIPYGQTITYQHLALRLGNMKVIRAAASANGKNPLGIIIPCHRVVGVDGKLTGYAGGLHRKQWLLAHEARISGNSSQLF